MSGSCGDADLLGLLSLSGCVGLLLWDLGGTLRVLQAILSGSLRTALSAADNKTQTHVMVRDGVLEMLGSVSVCVWSPGLKETLSVSKVRAAT